MRTQTTVALPEVVGSARIGWRPFSYDNQVASARLRSFLPCRHLAAAGCRASIVAPDGRGAYDCIVFQKAYSERDLDLARRCVTRGVKVVLDLCDNHLYNPSGDPALAQRADRLRRMIDLADAITVSSPVLATFLPRRSLAVIDDAVEVPALCPASRRWQQARRTRRGARRRPVRLVWFGHSGSESPAFGLIHLRNLLPELEHLHRSLPLRLTAITNSRLSFDRHLSGSAIPTRYVRWRHASFGYHLARHDVCIIPIESNPFTICKTNNRAVLSLLLGVPVVADMIPSYEELGEWILFDHWSSNIPTYAHDIDLVRQHVANGRSYVQQTYTPRHLVEQWSGALCAVLSGTSR